MKNILITSFLVLTSFLGIGQNYYKATITEFYTYNESSKEWELYQKNSDVNITVVVEEEFISFQAKTPSFYKIYSNSKEPFNTKSMKGYRYMAKDLREEKIVKIDVLASENNFALVSIIDENKGYNLRFFLTKIVE